MVMLMVMLMLMLIGFCADSERGGGAAAIGEFDQNVARTAALAPAADDFDRCAVEGIEFIH